MPTLRVPEIADVRMPTFEMERMQSTWEHAVESYPAGKKVAGKVVSLTDYGAFIEMEAGIEGLIAGSEIP